MTIAPAVSVVIPTRNGGTEFKQVLSKLQRQAYPRDLEVLVVDSCSTDGTPELARAAGANVVRVAVEKFNHGLTRNQGIQLACGDIVILLTQDAVPADEHLISRLVARFDDPMIAGVYARQIARPEHDLLIRRNVTDHFSPAGEPYTHDLDGASSLTAMQPPERYSFCRFDNVCASIRRSVWETVPFQEVDFAEDLDWSKRVLEAGWRIAYEPAAAVVHSHDRSLSYEYRRTYYCHRALYALFGMESIPNLRKLLRAVRQNALQDGMYVWNNEARLGQRLRLLLAAPWRSTVCLAAQYHGARDERLQHVPPFKIV